MPKGKNKVDSTDADQPQTTALGVNTPPMANNEVDTTVDESEGNFGMSDFDANKTVRKQNKQMAKDIKLAVKREEKGAIPEVSVSNAVGINPSSTYPGRDMELAENDMEICLLYTSPSPRDRTRSRMPSSA